MHWVSIRTVQTCVPDVYTLYAVFIQEIDQSMSWLNV